MNEMNLAKITELRHSLHRHAELSCHETETKKLLIRFLKENTTLEIEDRGAWFYAVHREPAERTFAFRADFDALPAPDGTVKHLCGHDGHCAALCGLALELEGKRVGHSVVLVFQHAEEIGVGAKECASVIRECGVDEIFGMHNIPGYPEGEFLVRRGTMACASKGMILSLEGTPAHAAYPEDGKNPSFAVGKLLEEIRSLSDPGLYQQLVLCTVVGIRVGEKSFGVSASEGELYLTIRGALEEELEKLQSGIEKKARELAEAEGLRLRISYMDEFPATVNHDEAVARILKAAEKLGRPLHILEEPMRWSEDFGTYLKEANGAFFGIGAGESCPALHTADYEFPDVLLADAVSAWESLL
jgi:amidohydrolase